MGAGGSIMKHNNNDKPETSLSGGHMLGKDMDSFTVSLGFWPGKTIILPESFKLKISYESLDFVRLENDLPIIQFPFQNIICWGSSQQNFQFKIFDLENAELEKRDQGILISLKTSQGKIIEDKIMQTIQHLMSDINQRAISKPEFAILLQSLLDDENNLKENWMLIIDQFTASGRLFLAKQGMELLSLIGPKAPFEKMDLACLLYDRMINKNSVQLLINTFEDPQEKENLIIRLKLDKIRNSFLTTDCLIMPERMISSKIMQNTPPPSF